MAYAIEQHRMVEANTVLTAVLYFDSAQRTVKPTQRPIHAYLENVVGNDVWEHGRGVAPSCRPRKRRDVEENRLSCVCQLAVQYCTLR